MPNVDQKAKKQIRWYFSGLAGACAVCVTHPMDLIKTNLHMRLDWNVTTRTIIPELYSRHGVRGFYQGLCAAVARQMTYSTARFAVYDGLRSRIKRPSLGNKLLIAGTAGLTCGIIGVPFDLVNVRMQSDVGLPDDERKYYKHVIDACYRIFREEGVNSLLSATSVAIVRTVLLTVGQIGVYDETKSTLINTYNCEDNLKTHFVSSFFASGVTTVITQPVDFFRSHFMNAFKGQFTNPLDLFKELLQTCPRFVLLRGMVPSFGRICLNTVLTFFFLEEFRRHFGYIPENQDEVW